MTICRKCENLNRTPVFVVDYNPSSPFENAIGHWEDGYLCYWTGEEARTVEELFNKCKCNKEV